MRGPFVLAAVFLILACLGANAVVAANDYGVSNNQMRAYPMPSAQNYQTNGYYNYFLDDGGRAFVLASLDVGSNVQLPADLTVYIPGQSVEMKYAMIQGSTGSGKVDFKKLGGNSFQLELPSVIVGGGPGVTNIVLFYRVGGYARKGILNWDYDVQTPQWPFDVDYTRVGVGVDSGLYIKGGAAQTDYQETFGMIASASKAMDAGVASQEYQAATGRVASLASQARSSGTVVKEKRNLEKNDVFHVQGSYADANWKLYAFEWLGWLVGIAIVLFLLWKFALPAVSGFLGSLPLFALPAAAPASGKKKAEETGFNFGRVTTSGFVSAVVYSFIVDAIALLLMLADRSHYRYSPNFGGWFLLLALFIGIVGFFILLTFIASRFGWSQGIVAGILFVGFSVVLVPVSFFLTYIVFSMISSMLGGNFYL